MYVYVKYNLLNNLKEKQVNLKQEQKGKIQKVWIERNSKVSRKWVTRRADRLPQVEGEDRAVSAILHSISTVESAGQRWDIRARIYVSRS